MEDIIIRAATFNDSPAIARVQVDSYLSAYAGIFPQSYFEHFTYEEQTEDWQNLLKNEKKGGIYYL
jgi:hypothetical protein